MLRRTLALAAVALAVTAGPALASMQWHTQMKYGSETASRALGTCTLSPGWRTGSVRVACPAHRQATLTYSFPTQGKASGTPRVGVSRDGSATVRSKVSVGKTAIKVTVTVSGPGWAQLNSVSVGYYAK